VNKVTSKDGTTIAYDQAGEGPVVILVDGAMCGRSFGPMTALIPLLAPHFTVIHYDRRGRGDSGDTAPYAVEREVEDIEALINAAGGSAYIYGISSGAVLALDAAGRLPAITKLAMYEPPLILDDSRPPIPDDYLDKFKEMLAEGRRGDMVEHFMTVGVGMPAEAVAPMRAMPMWPAMEAIAPTLIYDTTIMGDFTLPAAVAASIRVPALVMGGGASPFQLQHAAQAMAEAIPGAQLRMLEGQTHDVAAEALAPALIEFFSGQPGDSTAAYERPSV
jgi:pimeloyl-ACP methyl ester carboxylesterase